MPENNDPGVAVLGITVTDACKAESRSLQNPQRMLLFSLLVSVPWENNWGARWESPGPEGKGHLENLSKQMLLLCVKYL